MTDRDLGTYQMLWDCSSCGTTKLLGLEHRHCGGCGAAQDEDARYFPSDEDKVAVQDHTFVGADAECPACGSPMSATVQNCTNCGSGMDGAAKVDLVDAAPKAPPPKPKSGGCGKLLVVGLVVGLALLAVMIFWKKDVTAELSGKSWSRSIDVEVYGPQSKSAWCDQMPARARKVTRKSEVRDHKKIPDGETCTTKKRDNGDGSFTEYQDCKPKYRKEPIYADKCRFQVDEWTKTRTERAEGSVDPHWPDPQLKRAGSCVGCEREGRRSQEYRGTFAIDGGDSFTCTWDQAAWEQKEVGSRWTTKASVMTGGASCGSLELTR